ncbi:MAG: hypothetical protein K8I27_14920 [Planctomycetes bacterium]|nr:hypothetical protein [Planctomycetota bacterium]
MTDNPFLSKEHFRKVDQRYALKQRRIVEDIAKACEIVAGYRHAGATAAENVATGIQTALLEYEIALASADRHAFGDKRRRRARKPLFEQPDAARLNGPDRSNYARAVLAEAYLRLRQAGGNLGIRTNPELPKELRSSDKHDRQFLNRLKPVLRQMRDDLQLIGWDVEGSL